MTSSSRAAFHFGPDDRPLFGWLHRPLRLRPRSAAVLLCNPMGEEAARAHRLYRVLGAQLERAGYPALRFDYSGTGDSAGDAAGATVDAWLDDVAAAAAELGRAAPGARLVMVGLRLGASLAALASARRDLRVKHMVLWDPVVDGGVYLRELAGAHRAYMREEMGEGRYRDTLAVDADGIPREALGTPLGPALVAGLRAVDLTRELPRADHVTVVATRTAADVAALRTALGSRPTLRWVDRPDSAAWDSDAALNAATVPMDILQAILARVEEVSP